MSATDDSCQTRHPLGSSTGKDTERAGGRNGQRPKGYRTGRLEKGRRGRRIRAGMGHGYITSIGLIFSSPGIL